MFIHSSIVGSFRTPILFQVQCQALEITGETGGEDRAENHLSSEWEHKWIRKYALLEESALVSLAHSQKGARTGGTGHLDFLGVVVGCGGVDSFS